VPPKEILGCDVDMWKKEIWLVEIDHAGEIAKS
jgi:hypothetical protein